MKYMVLVLFFCLTTAQALFGQSTVWSKLASDPICVPDGYGTLYVAELVSGNDRMVSEIDPEGNVVWSRTFHNWDGMYYHSEMGLVVAADDSLVGIFGGMDLGASSIWTALTPGTFFGGTFDASGNFYYCVYGTTIFGNQAYAAKITVAGWQEYVVFLPSSYNTTGFVREKFLPFATNDGTIRIVKSHVISKTKTTGMALLYQEETFHTTITLNASNGATQFSKQFLKETTYKYKDNGKGTVEYSSIQYPENYLFAKGKLIFGGKFITTYDKLVNSMNVKKKYVSIGKVLMIDSKAKVKTFKFAGKGRIITTSPASEIDTMSGYNTITVDDSGNVYAAGGVSSGKTKNGSGNYSSSGIIHRINVETGKKAWENGFGGSGPIAVRKIVFHPSRQILIWLNIEDYRNAISRLYSANGNPVLGSALFLPFDILTLQPCDQENYFYATVTYLGFTAIAKYSAALETMPIQQPDAMQVEPKEFALNQNYPNPFNPSTTIGFTIKEAGFTTLKIYNMLGQEVATLINEVKEQGEYSVQWDAGALPSGVYTYRIEVQPEGKDAAPFQSVKTMMLVK